MLHSSMPRNLDFPSAWPSVSSEALPYVGISSSSLLLQVWTNNVFNNNSCVHLAFYDLQMERSQLVALNSDFQGEWNAP